MTPEGFEVKIEGRGDAAVARILNESPKAVVLDVNLPGMDGISVCRRTVATCDHMTMIERQRDSVERMSFSRRFAVQPKSILAEWTYLTFVTQIDTNSIHKVYSIETDGHCTLYRSMWNT